MADEDDVVDEETQSSAYLLFYKRREPGDPPPPPRKAKVKRNSSASHGSARSRAKGTPVRAAGSSSAVATPGSTALGSSQRSAHRAPVA